jgi:hypothetical protein
MIHKVWFLLAVILGGSIVIVACTMGSELFK